MFKRIKHYLQVAHTHASSKLSLLGNSLTMTLIGVLVILGPLFFIPVRNFPVMTSKGFFVFLIGVIALLVYGISILRKGVIILPRRPVFTILGLIVVTGFIGTLFASGFKMSFLGYGFETTTWLFMALFALAAFLAYRAIASYERIGTLYGGMLVAFLILALFHVVRFLVGPAFGNLGILGTSTSTLIGSWSDLAIFFGFVALFCVATLELAGLKKSFKWIVGGIGTLALVLLLFMNISMVWIVLGLVSLVFALYLFSFAYWDTEAKTYRKEHRAPWFVLALFAISVAAIFFGSFFNSLASRYQSISWNDVRPSVSMTAKVFGKSLAHNFATGYGPNGFNQAWSMAKPAALSGKSTVNTNFSQGFGYIPTQIASNGIVGAILWIGLFVFLVMALIRKTTQGFAHALDRYFSILMGVGVLYLGIMAWVYIPGTYLLILLAVLIGAFLSLSPSEKSKPDIMFSFIKDPRASFFGIFGVTLVVVATLFAGYVGIRKTASFVHYVRGATLLNQNNLQGGTQEISTAAAFSAHDLYHQELATLALGDVNRISAAATAANKDAVSKQVEQRLGLALGYAQAATKENPGDYKNWLLLGNVYRSMVSLGVTDAYDRATDAYGEAQKRAPHDVTVRLYLAQLELASKNTDKALSIIRDSINEFPTADAYILRAQIEISQQKYDDAIESVKAAVGLNAYDADLVYQYGLLLFTQKHYSDSIPVFQRTILLNRNYAVAYVYLGVAYERSGDMTDATKVYDYIKKQFPGGAEAIDRVKNGAGETPAPVTSDQEATTPKAAGKLPVKTPVAPTPKKP